jgi:hypothetical protein
MRHVVPVLLALLLLPLIPLSAADDDCATFGCFTISTNSVPFPVPDGFTYYLDLAHTGCPRPGPSNCHFDALLWQESNGIAGLQRRYEFQQKPDTLLLA